MTRMTPFSSPLLLGFDTMEKTLERIAKTGDGYPPYNIERLCGGTGSERLRITLAVAGFASEDLEVMTEDSQLVIRGRQSDATEREYLHRGWGLELNNGHLALPLDQPEPERLVRRVHIAVQESALQPWFRLEAK